MTEVLPKIRIVIDRGGRHKQLLIDDEPLPHVQDATVRVSTEPLSEVVITLLTDDVQIIEGDMR